MVGELDSFSIQDLETRYDISRSNIYNRIQGLKRKGYAINPTTTGNRSVYNAAQVAFMDRCDQHLKAGGTLSTFPAADQIELSYIRQDTPTLSYRTQDGVTINEPDAASNRFGFLGEQLVEKAIQGLAAIFPTPLPPARKGLELAAYRELAEAAREAYQLSTQNVANLLGLKPTTIVSYGHRFEDGGFVFTRVGKRKGGQIAWLVDRTSPNEHPSQLELPLDPSDRTDDHHLIE
jgi:hypothetical protein